MHLDRLTRPLGALRRHVLAHRRLLAALLVATSVATGVRASTAPPPPAVPVLTAAHDLPAGAVLGTDDLVTVAFAPGTAPDGASPDALGHTLAAPLRAGEPLTDVRLVGPGLATGDPDRVAVPVRLPDAAAVALLDVGDRVDLLATDPQAGGSEVVAAAVTVLAVPAPVEDASSQPGALVVLGVPSASVTRVADASVRYFLTYAFTR